MARDSNDELITLFETIRLGGVAYSRGCGVFDGITILVEERGALPTSGLDARTTKGRAHHMSAVLDPTVNAMIMQQSTCQYEEGPARAARGKKMPSAARALHPATDNRGCVTPLLHLIALRYDYLLQ